MGWAWLFLLLATYPWLLGADLAGDAFATSGLVFFVSGAVLIAPCRRLRRWQCVLLAAGAGFLFEARRPIPDGLLALPLVGFAVFLSTHRAWLRSTPRMLQAAAAVNALACLLWSAGAAHEADLPLAARLGQLALQVFFATVLGAVALVPLALTQNAVMDRLGVPPPEQP
jgi:hypothetical protein